MMRKGQKQLKGKIIIKSRLRLDSGLHIGAASDFAPIGAVDSPFIRDVLTKQPIIPGSSLKGKLRTLLAKSMTDSYVLPEVAKDPEVIGRLFGTADKEKLSASRLQFFDLKLNEASVRHFEALDTDTYIGEIKFENAIDRATAMANPRQIERVPAGAEFDLVLVYNVEKEEEMPEDMNNLLVGLRLLTLDYLGGHGSRGYGRVSFHDFKLEAMALNNQEELQAMCDGLAEEFNAAKLEGVLG